MTKNIATINPHQLDLEWIEQPHLYEKYATKLADAKKELDLAKGEADLIKAEQSLSIRKDPAAFGLDKVTETSINACALTQSAVQDALCEITERKHEADILQGIVTALDHRKKALEKLVDLHLSSYYSTPQARTNKADHRSSRSKSKKSK